MIERSYHGRCHCGARIIAMYLLSDDAAIDAMLDDLQIFNGIVAP